MTESLQNREIFRFDWASSSPVRQKVMNVVGGAAQKITALSRLNDVYAAIVERAATCDDFLERALDVLQVELCFNEEDLNRIPKEGPTMVMANHPFGGIEGIIVGYLLRQRRRNAKILANHLLERIPELRDLFFFVDPFGTDRSLKRNIKPMKDAMKFLKNGGLLGAFPAGEVSHATWTDWRVSDPKWNPSVARFVRKSGATVVPLYFEGGNSLFFQCMGLLHPSIRTALLPRQFLNKQESRLTLRIGSPIRYHKMASSMSDEELTEYFRFRTYLLGKKEDEKSTPARSTFMIQRKLSKKESVVPYAGLESLLKEIEALPTKYHLHTSGDYDVYYAHKNQMPHIMNEIGRLREITFREAGEGTGGSIDIDSFDDTYFHLFAWNRVKGEIIGAYRLGSAEEIVKKYGLKGLYTHKFFDYDERLLKLITPALEVGRSFVCTQYQNNYMSLLLLWKGISEFIVRNPKYKYLFGPVSISNEYSPVSKSLLVNYFKEHDHDSSMASLVTPRRPLRRKTFKGLVFSNLNTFISGINDLSEMIADIETKYSGVPILLKHYLKLGGKIIGFNVDKEFSDALDGLVVVNLLESNPKTLKLYMGKEGYSSFMSHHGLSG